MTRFHPSTSELKSGALPLEQPDRYCETYLTELGCKCWDWIHLAQDRDQWCGLVNTVIKLRIQQKVT
jgi:hypothetical protein